MRHFSYIKRYKTLKEVVFNLLEVKIQSNKSQEIGLITENYIVAYGTCKSIKIA